MTLSYFHPSTLQRGSKHERNCLRLLWIWIYNTAVSLVKKYLLIWVICLTQNFSGKVSGEWVVIDCCVSLLCSSFMKPHNHHSVALPSTIKPFPVQLPASDIPHPGCGIWFWFWFTVLLCWGFNPEPHCSSTGAFLMIPEDVNRISGVTRGQSRVLFSSSTIHLYFSNNRGLDS